MLMWLEKNMIMLKFLATRQNSLKFGQDRRAGGQTNAQYVGVNPHAHIVNRGQRQQHTVPLHRHFELKLFSKFK